MSRCFPYPPPYLREAEIESIKKEKKQLEKDAKKDKKREKKERKEKKKNKEKEKKEKQSSQERELSEDPKKSHKRKYEEHGSTQRKEELDNHQHKSKKPRDEQLERSGLSEEHGQPSSVWPANCWSPESSQDSTKRRNGSMPSPSPSLTNSGSTIRIKLQASKPRQSLPGTRTPRTAEVMPAPQVKSSREQVPVPQATKQREPTSVPQGAKVREQVLAPQASKSRLVSASLPQKSRSVALRETLKPREPVLAPRLKEPMLDIPVPKPREPMPVPQAHKSVPKPSGVTGQAKQHVAMKVGVEQDPSSSGARMTAFRQPPLKKTKLEPCARSQIPREEKRDVFQKPVPVMKPNPGDAVVSPVMNKHSVPRSAQAVNPKLRDARSDPASASKLNPVLQQQVQALNTKQIVAGNAAQYVLKQDRKPVVPGVPPVSTDEPCFSGRKTGVAEKRESKRHHHHSSSRKRKRKEAEKLFEELITSWKPPVLGIIDVDMGDQDWLKSGRNEKRSDNEKEEDDWLSMYSSKCKAGEGLLAHTNGMEASYQTRAVYMPEFDMYQLPYVVPF